MAITEFQPSTRDVQINSSGGGNGTSPSFSVVNNLKILLFFDVSSITSTDLCSSAVLSLWNTVSNYAITIDAYAILSGNSGWTESATDTTINGTNTWAGSNWCNTSGVDYNGTSIGSATSNTGFYVKTDWNLTPSVVKTWFGATNSNYGFFLKTSSANSNFYFTREETTFTTYRPKLTITHGPAVQRRTLSGIGTKIGSRGEQA